MNAIEIEIHRHKFQSVAEEMGIVLRATALSANIKERLDFSCAVSGADGAMIAQAAHIPVHLGSCHLTARYILDEVDLEPGDVVLVNDPFRGGTHLPDVTLFKPVFAPGKKRPDFGVMTRAHHADVGGGVPGSMGDFDEIFKEGIIIPPVKIVSRGTLVRDVESFFLANVRTPDERQGDLQAQIAATERGCARLQEMIEVHGGDRLARAGRALMDRAARAVSEVIAAMPNGKWSFEDRLDGEGSARIVATVEVSGDRLVIDFEGSSGTIARSLNAHEAITLSVVFYCIRCLADESIPTNSGVLRPVTLKIPPDTIVGARSPAAVAGGNVETSQRIVDVVFGALAQALPDRIPAASQGTMNNVSLGGYREDGRPFTYFETLAGGAGGSATRAGASGLHTHMTNTMNTPIEAFENDFPMRVTAYRLRQGSGGRGTRPGGEGIVRELESLVPVTVSLLTTRRQDGPYGLAGGFPGAVGRNTLIRNGRRKKLNPCATVELSPGDRLRIETPGGGGHGGEDE